MSLVCQCSANQAQRPNSLGPCSSNTPRGGAISLVYFASKRGARIRRTGRRVTPKGQVQASRQEGWKGGWGVVPSPPPWGSTTWGWGGGGGPPTPLFASRGGQRHGGRKDETLTRAPEEGRPHTQSNPFGWRGEEAILFETL